MCAGRSSETFDAARLNSARSVRDVAVVIAGTWDLPAPAGVRGGRVDLPLSPAFALCAMEATSGARSHLLDQVRRRIPLRQRHPNDTAAARLHGVAADDVIGFP